MNNTKSEQGQFVHIILLLATVVATIFIFRIIAGSFENQPSKFWVSLFALIFAEVLTFGSSIWLSRSSGFDNKMFAYNLTLVGLVTVCDIGVVILALLALTPIDSAWIVSLQIILILGICIGIAAFHLSSDTVEQIEIRDTEQRKSTTSHRNQVDDLLDRASRLTCPGAEAVQKAVSSVREELEYCSSESLPGSETIDNEINNQIGQLTSLIIAAENCGDDKNVANATTTELIQKTVELKLSISKRDRIMLELRN